MDSKPKEPPTDLQPVSIKQAEADRAAEQFSEARVHRKGRTNFHE